MTYRSGESPGDSERRRTLWPILIPVGVVGGLLAILTATIIGQSGDIAHLQALSHPQGSGHAPLYDQLRTLANKVTACTGRIGRLEEWREHLEIPDPTALQRLIALEEDIERLHQRLVRHEVRLHQFLNRYKEMQPQP